MNSIGATGRPDQEEYIAHATIPAGALDWPNRRPEGGEQLDLPPALLKASAARNPVPSHFLVELCNNLKYFGSGWIGKRRAKSIYVERRGGRVLICSTRGLGKTASKCGGGSPQRGSVASGTDYAPTAGTTGGASGPESAKHNVSDPRLCPNNGNNNSTTSKYDRNSCTVLCLNAFRSHVRTGWYGKRRAMFLYNFVRLRCSAFACATPLGTILVFAVAALLVKCRSNVPETKRSNKKDMTLL